MKIKGTVMTQAEEVRELRNWLRAQETKNEARIERLHNKIDRSYTELHKKMDTCNRENQDEHKTLSAEISKINVDGKVNSSKVTALASLVSLVVSGLVIVAFQVMAHV
jgi:hypothetical protein